MFKLLEFKVWPSKTGVAKLLVQYYDLMIMCDLVLYTKGEPKLWVRLPEVWKDNKKICLNRWISKTTDAFQDEIIRQVHTERGYGVKEAIKTHQIFKYSRFMRRQSVAKKAKPV